MFFPPPPSPESCLYVAHSYALFLKVLNICYGCFKMFMIYILILNFVYCVAGCCVVLVFCKMIVLDNDNL